MAVNRGFTRCSMFLALLITGLSVLLLSGSAHSAKLNLPFVPRVETDITLTNSTLRAIHSEVREVLNWLEPYMKELFGELRSTRTEIRNTATAAMQKTDDIASQLHDNVKDLSKETWDRADKYMAQLAQNIERLHGQWSKTNDLLGKTLDVLPSRWQDTNNIIQSVSKQYNFDRLIVFGIIGGVVIAGYALVVFIVATILSVQYLRLQQRKLDVLSSKSIDVDQHARDAGASRSSYYQQVGTASQS